MIHIPITLTRDGQPSLSPPHGTLLGTLQSQESGDPELRAPTTSPIFGQLKPLVGMRSLNDPEHPLNKRSGDSPEATYERQPDDPDPGAVTLIDGQFTAADVQAATAMDAGIDLEGRDHQTSDSEHLDSLVDVGRDDPDTVPLHALAAIGERAVRQCIADAFASWAENIEQWLHKPDRESSNADTPMKVLYLEILDNLHTENIDTAVVWPLVQHVVLHTQESIFRRVFGNK